MCVLYRMLLNWLILLSTNFPKGNKGCPPSCPPSLFAHRGHSSFVIVSLLRHTLSPSTIEPIVRLITVVDVKEGKKMESAIRLPFFPTKKEMKNGVLNNQLLKHDKEC